MDDNPRGPRDGGLVGLTENSAGYYYNRVCVNTSGCFVNVVCVFSLDFLSNVTYFVSIHSPSPQIFRAASEAA